MNNKYFQKIILNFFAVIFLITLIATPLYFAKNFAKVAGVKSASPFLIVSQIDKFPNVQFSQQGDTYQLSFTKLGPSQAYIDILIINNPTDKTQTYTIQKLSGQSTVFFGQDLDNQLTTISVPVSTSVPLSLYSDSESASSSQTVDFTINH